MQTYLERSYSWGLFFVPLAIPCGLWYFSLVFLSMVLSWLSCQKCGHIEVFWWGMCLGGDISGEGCYGTCHTELFCDCFIWQDMGLLWSFLWDLPGTGMACWSCSGEHCVCIGLYLHMYRILESMLFQDDGSDISKLNDLKGTSLLVIVILAALTLELPSKLAEGLLSI